MRYGASALGLVSAMPSGPGVLAEELIAEIAAIVPPGVAIFLLTSATETGRITEQVRTAIEAVQTFGVDVCTGVRVNGRLDDRLARCATAVRQL